MTKQELVSLINNGEVDICFSWHGKTNKRLFGEDSTTAISEVKTIIKYGDEYQRIIDDIGYIYRGIEYNTNILSIRAFMNLLKWVNTKRIIKSVIKHQDHKLTFGIQ